MIPTTSKHQTNIKQLMNHENLPKIQNSQKLGFKNPSPKTTTINEAKSRRGKRKRIKGSNRHSRIIKIIELIKV